MERDFIAQKTREFHIKKYLESRLSNVGLSEIKVKKIPLGEKIIISTSRPGLIVGSKGSNIKDLTRYLKKEFKLENPQIEIDEIKNIFFDANVVAEKIASSLERFGPARFKSIGHKMLENVIKAGALGVEIIISGKIPGARAKSWRFYQGYLKKCGDISLTGVRKAKRTATLKSGVIGIKVAIMPPDIELPDKIILTPELVEEPTGKSAEAVEEKLPSEEEAIKKEEVQKEKIVGDKTPQKKIVKKKAPGEKKPRPEEEAKSGKKVVSGEEVEAGPGIPSAEELIKETKEKFGPEESRVLKRKGKTAQQLISEAAG